MSYCGYITTIKNIREHSNADKLNIAEVFGTSVVVGKNLQVGDLIVYFPTDGQLGEEFAKENNMLRIKGSNDGGYLDPIKRNIRTIRLRGEESDGIIMELDSLSKFTDITTLKEGDTITTLGGVLICQKYVPVIKRQSNQGQVIKQKKTIDFPFFAEHSSTSQLAYNLNSFKEGDLCYITLKMHGTSARTAHTIRQKTGFLPDFIERPLAYLKNKLNIKDTYEYVSGSRRVVLKNFEGGYYSGGNKFREKYHEYFKGKLPKGFSVFYEIVGYTDDGNLIMPECDNRKTKDKEFIKKYGNTTKFTYGCGVGQSDIYVYRITATNEDGEVIEIPWEQVKIYCEKWGVKHVPELDRFFFTTEEDLMERVRKHEIGADPTDATHLREGVIVRVDNKEKFTALKQKSFYFKVLEGIIKDDGILDMEEEESIKVAN